MTKEDFDFTLEDEHDPQRCCKCSNAVHHDTDGTQCRVCNEFICSVCQTPVGAELGTCPDHDVEEVRELKQSVESLAEQRDGFRYKLGLYAMTAQQEVR